jgi:hypothetical protein
MDSSSKSLPKALPSISRTALLSILGPASVLVLGYLAWTMWGAKKLDKTYYALQLVNIEVTLQPKWIRSNVAEEVYLGSNLKDVSVLDRHASATIARAFDSHPWIRNTLRVQKSAGGKVKVDVEYRQPIAMVYYDAKSSSAKKNPSDSQLQFLPVDREGVLLPTQDFSSEQVLDHLIIYAPGATPMGLIGGPFGDNRITEAVKLCELLAPLRRELKLERVYIDADPRAPNSNRWLLEIGSVSQKGAPARRYVWGHAPGQESSNEPLADVKLARLIDEVHNSAQANHSELPTVYLNTPDTKSSSLFN